MESVRCKWNAHEADGTAVSGTSETLSTAQRNRYPYNISDFIEISELYASSFEYNVYFMDMYSFDLGFFSLRCNTVR
jgi:hypothetical protein